VKYYISLLCILATLLSRGNTNAAEEKKTGRIVRHPQFAEDLEKAFATAKTEKKLVFAELVTKSKPLASCQFLQERRPGSIADRHDGSGHHLG
jgi:hypothetical protein